MSITNQGGEIAQYRIGEIVRYTRYENDLVNEPNKTPIPNKYFKVKRVDMDWGVVEHEKDTIGLSYITKTNFIERIKWWLFWR